MRKNKSGAIFFVGFLFVITVSVIGFKYILCDTIEPVSIDSTSIVSIFQDQYININIIYTKQDDFSEDMGFASEAGGCLEDIIILEVENLKVEGLIFVPTPKVSVLDSQGEIIEKLKPYTIISDIADPQGSMLIFLTSPIPQNKIDAGLYSYIIDMEYHYIFYDRVDRIEEITLNIDYEKVNGGNFSLEIFSDLLKILHYFLTGILILYIFAGRKR